MNKNEKQVLRSKKTRDLLGNIPSSLVNTSIAIIGLQFIILFIAAILYIFC